MTSLQSRLRAALIDCDTAQRALLRHEAPFFHFFPQLRGRFRYPQDLAPAAVLVPIIERADGATILLTYRAADMPTHAGEIAFPGGGGKAGDDSLLHTALREAREEIGLDPAFTTLVGYLDARPMGSKFRVQPVVCTVAPEAGYTLCAREVASVFELPLPIALDAGRYRRRTLDTGYGPMPDLLELRHGEHHIWGATAEILLDLCVQCEGAAVI